MDIQSLKAFVTIAEESSFSMAAQRLHLTQPAMSKRIASLEHQLGMRLFDRIGRTIHLTEAGRILLPRASKIVLELQDLHRAMAAIDGKVAGPLALATSHHIGLHRLPPVLRRYSVLFPDVKLDIRFVDSEDAFEAVTHGQLEMGIITLPPTPPPKLNAIPVWHDPLEVVVAVDHPLADHGPVSLDDLSSYAAVLPAQNTFTRKIVESKFAQAGKVINVSMSTNYMETLRMMVVTGLGWSVLPRTLLNQDLVVIDVPSLVLTRFLGIIAHADHSLSNAARAMIDVVRQAADTTHQKWG